MTEIWKNIDGTGSYKISNKGRVMNRTQFLKPIFNKTYKGTGYLRAGITINKIKKPFYIHRLVAIAFIPNPENKPQVNHIDGNKLNNSVENLEWCTVSENNIHAYKVLGKQSARGEQRGNNKLTNEDVKYILNNKNIHYTILSEKFSVSRSTIYDVLKNRTWLHISQDQILMESETVKK